MGLKVYLLFITLFISLNYIKCRTQNKKRTNIPTNFNNVSTTEEYVPVTIVIPISVSEETENDIESVTQLDTSNIIIESISVTPAPNITVNEINSTSPSLNISSTAVGPFRIQRPCSCKNGLCGCCTGPILQRLNTKACGNITFIPEEFVFDLRFTFNNRTIVRQKLSVSDPPPLCFNPGAAPFIEICAELYNIHVKNRNAHACLNIEANIADIPIYSASFRCFSVGSSGLKTGQKEKPIKTTGPRPVNIFGTSDNEGGFLGGLFQPSDSDDNIFEPSDIGIFEDIGDILNE